MHSLPSDGGNDSAMTRSCHEVPSRRPASPALAWLLIALPLAGAIVLLVGGRRLGPDRPLARLRDR